MFPSYPPFFFKKSFSTELSGLSVLGCGWAGQSGVVAPWDVTAVAALGLRRQLPSTSNLGVNKHWMRFL